MWPGLRKSTMWAQITSSYIFTNIFRSKCTIPFPSCRRKPIKFCSSDEYFVAVVCHCEGLFFAKTFLECKVKVIGHLTLTLTLRWRWFDNASNEHFPTTLEHNYISCSSLLWLHLIHYYGYISYITMLHFVFCLFSILVVALALVTFSCDLVLLMWSSAAHVI